MTRIILGTLGVLGIIGAIFGIEWFFESVLCDTDIKERHASPAGDWIAIEFERGCGVGSPLNTQVSLIPKGRDFDADRFPPFFVLHDHRKVAVRWIGDRALLIRLPKEPGTSLKDSPANIDVRYESD